MLEIVSQFTLYGQVVKGTKPDFHRAMGPDPARAMYGDLIKLAEREYRPDRIQSTLLTFCCLDTVVFSFCHSVGFLICVLCILCIVLVTSSASQCVQFACCHVCLCSYSIFFLCSDGQFGAMMQVALVNDGPVTLIIESPFATAAAAASAATETVTAAAAAADAAGDESELSRGAAAAESGTEKKKTAAAKKERRCSRKDTRAPQQQQLSVDATSVVSVATSAAADAAVASGTLRTSAAPDA